MGIIMFNGVSSEDFGILVEHPPGYQIPERNYEVTHIPGRNGDVLFDTGSYDNAERSYKLAFGDMVTDYFTMANKASQWLHEPNGYARLEDSYEPDIFRLAYYNDAITFENILSHAGRATIKFMCKPQRYLKIGEDRIPVENGSNIYNPTSYEAKPVIYCKIGANSKIEFGDGAIIFKANTPEAEVVIDIETFNIKKNLESFNKYVVFGNNLPILKPGDNSFQLTNVTNMEIIPRWWTI